MSNTLEYVLDLKGDMQDKLKIIGIENDKQLATWARVQQQVHASTDTLDKMGVSIGSLKQRIAALQAQREWIPERNHVALKATSSEIENLEKQVEKLQNTSKKGNPIQSLLGGASKFLATTGMNFVTSQLSAGLEKARALHESEAGLKNTMQHNGSYTPKNFENVVKTSEKMASGIGYSSAEVIGLQSQLRLGGNIGENKMQRMVMASADMSTKFGMGLGEAGNTLATAAKNPEMMNSLGTQLKIDPSVQEHIQNLAKSGHEAQAQMELLSIVEQKVGGSAKAAFDADPMLRFNKAIEFIQTAIGEAVMWLQSQFAPVLESVANIFKGFVGFIENHKTAFIVLASVVGLITIAFKIYNTWQMIMSAWTEIVTALKSGEAAAWWASTVPMLITVGVIAAIIAVVLALILVIVYCVKHVSGWGDLWKHTMNGAKLVFLSYAEFVKANFNAVVNSIMIGIDLIKVGWYKFKQAVGIGKSSENQAMIAQISSDVTARENSIKEGYKKMNNTAIAAKNEFVAATGSLHADMSFGQYFSNTKNSLMPNTPALAGNNQGSGGGFGTGSGTGNKAKDTIASGGSRNTSIIINLGKMVENIIFQGSVKENAQDLTRQVEEILLRTLYAAESAG
jgi:hypothetical protein